MSQQKLNKEPIQLFYSYSHEDESLRSELEKHLMSLKRQELISYWHDRRIGAGSEWAREIDKHLENSQIILLLISADFLASDYCYDFEMRRALQKHEAGEATVIPIILRPADWSSTPFAMLQALPRDGKPVTKWADRDEAWLNVVTSIRLICEDILGSRKITTSPVSKPKSGQMHFRLFDVFKESGVPMITFVEPDDFDYIKLALEQPGRGVIIEGPSGIGKTTALENAIKQLGQQREPIKFKRYSARVPADVKALSNLEDWHNGAIAIDDFHRLDASLREQIADYLKYLADSEFPDKKLIVVGIPGTGKKLVDFAFDLATRISRFKLGKVSDETILKMIQKGEQALNIIFDRKSDIVRAAHGSLNIAQLLCFHIAASQNLNETQPTTKVLSYDLDKAVSRVMELLELKFEETVRRFSLLGGTRDQTCIELLQELARTSDGFLPLHYVRDARPNMAKGIDSLIKGSLIESLYREYPKCENHLFYDKSTPALVIDDPQFRFYLLKTPPEKLARLTGKREAVSRNKVFISYSHKDSKWLERLLVHFRPLERQGAIELWADTRIKAGANWREEIEKGLESAKVAVILISADFLASDFIASDELPPLLSAAEKDGAIIVPLILSPSLFNRMPEIAKYQSVNDPQKPLINLPRSEQETVLVKLAELIEQYLQT